MRSTVNLFDAYDSAAIKGVLFQLLLERLPHQNISHKAMPTWEEHLAFVDSRPYPAWYGIGSEEMAIGAVYLTARREIGVGVLQAYQGMGYGTAAVKALMLKHPGRFLANVNPRNAPSVRLFSKLGFDVLQHTYVLEAT